MEACLRERESEVTKMAQVSLIKTKLAQPGVAFPIQRSYPLNSQAPFLFCFFFLFIFSFFFNFSFLPRLSLSRSGQWMVDATVR